MSEDKVRLDKWLWAARFYKTRSLATEAIDSGKVFVDGDKVKPSKEAKIGQTLYIRKKELEVEVVIQSLASVRRGATEAQALYYETEASVAKREDAKVTKLGNHAKRERGAGRPTKRQIRDIRKFTGIDYS
jgi:ribosome-associated heat shock protein Hsp15